MSDETTETPAVDPLEVDLGHMVRWLAVYELQMNHESQARELQGEFNDALDALIDARIEKALKERERRPEDQFHKAGEILRDGKWVRP